MTDEPQIVPRTTQPYIGIRKAVPMDRIPEVADRIGELFGWLQLRGLAPAGPPFLKYDVIDMDRELVLEAGFPVEQLPDGDGDIFAATLPAGRYVTVMHHGHPDGLREATAELLRWADEQGLTWDKTDEPDGEHWSARLESYQSPPGVPMDNWDTELAFRLAD